MVIFTCSDDLGPRAKVCPAVENCLSQSQANVFKVLDQVAPERRDFGSGGSPPADKPMLEPCLFIVPYSIPSIIWNRRKKHDFSMGPREPERFLI